MLHTVKILQKRWLTYNVLCLSLEKPLSYSFYPGQAVEVTVPNPQFYGDQAPFTLTNLNDDGYLELIFRVYPDHNGMTLAMSKLNEGENLIIGEPWDSYRNLTPGIFIGGGTGVTSFISFLRHRKREGVLSDCRLFFVNKTERDIFLKDELTQILGPGFFNVLTREKKIGYLHGRIDMNLLRDQLVNFNLPFYICGPDDFAVQLKGQLILGGISPDKISIGY